MTTPAIDRPYPGIQVWQNPKGVTVLRLHYTADPTKNEKWAAAECARMSRPSLYRQEYEIDGEASLGQLLYALDEEATLEKSFPIPEDWTRYMALDPHPSVPHAMLWCAVDPYGDRWYYRELWPSKSCFRWDCGKLVGLEGPCPEEDNRFPISEYVRTMRYLESAENPQNRSANGKPFDEHIIKRVIDYSCRAFQGETRDGQKQLSMQELYEQHMTGTCSCEPKCPSIKNATFTDCKKDIDTGVAVVNEGLKPREVMDGTGKYVKRSRIHIFKDRCPELVWELKNNRVQQLSAVQAEKMDPTGRPVGVRKHMTDDLQYTETAAPIFIAPHKRSQWTPTTEGIAY